MKKFFAAIAILLTAALLCGCGIYSESESRYIASLLCFEGGRNVRISVEAVSGVGITGEESESFLLEASGEDAEEALYSLQSKLSKPLSLEHCAIVAVGSSIEPEQLSGVLELCRKSSELNLSCQMIAANDIKKLTEENESITAAIGYDIAGLIEHTAEHSGVLFGSRLYEIFGKLKRKNPFFSLPVIKKEGGVIAISGERFYRDYREVIELALEESHVYAMLCNSFSGGSVNLGNKIYKIKKTHTSFEIESSELPLRIKLSATLSGDAAACGDFKERAEALIERAKRENAGDIFGFSDNIFRRSKALWQEIKRDYSAAFSEGSFNVTAVNSGNA